MPLFVPKPPAGAASAAVVLLLASVIRAAPASAGMDPQPLAEIGAAAIAALGASDAQAVAALDPALRLVRCSQPLQAVASGAKTAEVRCADSPGWRLYVPVRVRREADVVVLVSPAASGVPIAASQLTVQRRDLGQATGAVFTDPAAVVGRIPGRPLATGLIPTEADLVLGAPLRRGDPVLLVSRTGGIEVRAQGRALGPSLAGGVVSVENATSHRILRGRLAAPGVVELLP